MVDRRSRLDSAVVTMRTTVADGYEAQGNDRDAAFAYSSGYIQSLLVNALIERLAPKQVEDLIAYLDSRVIHHNAQAAARAREAA